MYELCPCSICSEHVPLVAYNFIYDDAEQKKQKNLYMMMHECMN